MDTITYLEGLDPIKLRNYSNKVKKVKPTTAIKFAISYFQFVERQQLLFYKKFLLFIGWFIFPYKYVHELSTVEQLIASKALTNIIVKEREDKVTVSVNQEPITFINAPNGRCISLGDKGFVLEIENDNVKVLLYDIR